MATSTNPHPSWRGFQTVSLPEVPSWVEWLGRCGYVAKGIVYFIIGLLAFQVAIGAGGDLTGARGAIRELGQQPFGRILLGVVAFGLLSYTSWRCVQSVKDTEDAGSDAKGLAVRIGYAVSGLIHLLLALFAGAIAVGASSQVNQDSAATSSLIGTSWGRIVLGILGAIVIGIALYFIYKGYQAKFMEKYDLANMSEQTRATALYIGRIGLVTRGIAVTIIGAFLLNTAFHGSDSGEISGMSDALAAIAAQSFGKILLGATGFGLMCFAFHMCLMGYFRRFNRRADQP